MRVIAAGAIAVAFSLTGFAASAETEAQRGATLLRTKGCLACHSTDGTAKAGPTFKGLWGRTNRVVVSKGVPQDVVVDEAYIARSLGEPDAAVAAGYAVGSMPRFDASDADVHAIVAVLQTPDTLPASDNRRGGTIWRLAIAAAAFTVLHFLLSTIAVRKRLIAALTQRGFAAVYSVIALVTFIAMIAFYRTAPYVELWSPPRWTRWIPVLAMPAAFLLLVTGFSTPASMTAPRGIHAVTRHPVLWGFALWALAHLATNGELHVVIVGATILIVAIGGMFHIDARRHATLGAAWAAYAAKTSLVPFAAIRAGRATLVPAEIGLRRVAIALVLYLAFYVAHPYVIGASPAP